MPTYEYRCKDCGHTFDAYQAFTDDPLTECPACSGALKKLFGNVGISFKGSGFYKTDSRSSGTSSSKADGSSGDGAKADTGASTSDSGAASSSGDTGASKGSKGSGDAGGSSGTKVPTSST